MYRTPWSRNARRGPLWLTAAALSVALPTGLVERESGEGQWRVGPAAASADEDDPEIVAQAKLHYKLGLDAFQAGKYDVAIKELKRAHLLKRIPAILLNIGLTYRKMKDYDMSTYFYKKYLAEAPAEDKARPQAEAAVREIEEEKRAALAPPPKEAARPAVEAAVVKPKEAAVKPAAPAAPGAEQGKPGEAVKAAAPAAPATESSAPASEWSHNPIDAAPPGQTVDVRVQMPVMKGVKVMVFFRREGQPTWESQELKRRGNDKVARIPATVTGGRTFQYYIEARDTAGTLVKSAGSEASPNIVLIDPGAKQQVAEGQDDGGGGDDDKPRQGYTSTSENESAFDSKSAMERLRQQLNNQESSGQKRGPFGKLGWIGVGLAGGGVLALGGGGALLGVAKSWADQVSADSQCTKDVRVKYRDPATGNPTGEVGCPNFSGNPTASLNSSVDSRYPGSPTSADFEQQGRTFNTVGIALSAVGGAALAAGAALMVTDVVRRRAAERGADAPATPTTPKLKPGQKTRKVRKVIEVEEPETTFRLSPVLSPTLAGVVGELRF